MVALSSSSPSIQRGYEDLQEKTVISKADELEKAVERLIEDRFGGIDNLFMRGDAEINSTGSWALLIHSNMTDATGAYQLQGLGRPHVEAAVKSIKAEHRDELLQRFAFNYIYMSDNVFPYSVDNLSDLLTDAGVYLDDDDDDVVEALFETDGQFARTEADIADDCLKLLDEDGVVVILDSHQNKHQQTKINEFPQYQGDPGSKFALGKGLAWHTATTAPVVKARVLKAIQDGDIGPNTGSLSPPKVPQADTYVYDLTITYDEATGKSVGGYHCNPQADE